MPGFLDSILGKGVANRVRSIQYLGNIKSPDSIVKLIKYLGDENVEVRRAAAIALEQHYLTGDANAIVALTKALSDGDPGVRKNAALGLGEFVVISKASREVAAARQALIGLLKRESDEGVIKNAVVGLAHIQDPSLTGLMADAFKGKDRKLVAMSIDAISDLPPTDIRLEMKKALRPLL